MHRRPFLKFWIAFASVISATSSVRADEFNLLIQRLTTSDGLIVGALYVNGQQIGSIYENEDLAIPAGAYPGLLRYWSSRNFAQGPFGTIGKVGDFLLQIDTSKTDRTNILFHGGNRVEHSRGCIMLGAVRRENGIPIVDPGDTLAKLRRAFYGTDQPTSTPNVTITIKITDAEIVTVPPIGGTWSGNFTSGGAAMPMSFTFATNGRVVTGVWNSKTGPKPMSDLKVLPDRSIQFTFDVSIRASGKISEDLKSMSGNFTMSRGGGTWSLMKQ